MKATNANREPTDLFTVDLGAVQETLLIPLMGRAAETCRGGLVDDPKAVSIVDQLDYDFSKWRRSRSLVGASLRTRMMDEDVSAFLMMHPTGTVIELGCGLNTRFERLDNGSCRWIDLDLPDVIALRRRFFADTYRRRMMSASLLDDSWLDEVGEGPACFVSEAVLIYLDEADARRTLAKIATRFPGAWLVFDTTCRSMVEGQGQHDAMRHLPKESWFRWSCDDPRLLEGVGPGLVLDRSRTFADASPKLRRRLPWTLRAMLRFTPGLIRRRIEGYRLNRFIVSESPT